MKKAAATVGGENPDSEIPKSPRRDQIPAPMSCDPPPLYVPEREPTGVPQLANPRGQDQQPNAFQPSTSATANNCDNSNDLVDTSQIPGSFNAYDMTDTTTRPAPTIFAGTTNTRQFDRMIMDSFLGVAARRSGAGLPSSQVAPPPAPGLLTDSILF